MGAISVRFNKDEVPSEILEMIESQIRFLQKRIEKEVITNQCSDCVPEGVKWQ